MRYEFKIPQEYKHDVYIWCRDQFDYSYLDDRWVPATYGNLKFRDEKDAMWFVLQWGEYLI